MNEIEQKEIEEMTRAICECYMPTLGICTVDKKPCDCGCADYDFAKKFYNAGCLCVKDKVVLSKEEWLDLKGKTQASIFKEAQILQLKKELNDYKQRYESAEKRYEQLVQSSCEALEKKGKETAKEIFAKLRDMKRGFYINFSLMEEYEFNGILGDVEKEYGVEVENGSTEN